MVKTIKAIHMYGMNHPSSKNLYTPLYEKITKVLKKTPEIVLNIEQFSILFDKEALYTESEKDLSIAFKLFREGIRSFSVSDGLTFDELFSFLDIISHQSREHDIALELWESHFSHIDFYVVEEEDEIIDYKASDMETEPVDYDMKLKEIIQKEQLDINTPIAIHLADTELKTLTQEIRETTRMSFIPVTITTLLNFLKTERSREIIDSLLELLERCVDKYDFSNARRIVHRLSQDTELNPLEKLEKEPTIIGFKDMVNTAPDTIFNEFIAFIGAFSKETTGHFLKLLTHIKRKDRIASIRNRIVYILQDDPTPIKVFLSNQDSTILIHTIALLGMMKQENIPKLLEPLMHHRDDAVRVEIITALENHQKGHTIMQYLDDESSEVRIRALQALTNIRYLRVYEKILQYIKSKYFRVLEFNEQKEYFNCLIATGGRDVIKQLRKILFKWFLFGGKRYILMRQLAAVALVQISGEGALAILMSGLKKRNKDIRAACEMALKQK